MVPRMSFMCPFDTCAAPFVFEKPDPHDQRGDVRDRTEHSLPALSVRVLTHQRAMKCQFCATAPRLFETR